LILPPPNSPQGTGVGSLARLEEELLHSFQVDSFHVLGQGPSLLAALAASPQLQALLDGGAGGGWGQASAG
jgi:hypothetical protein